MKLPALKPLGRGASFLPKSMDVKKELEMKKSEILKGNVSRFLLIVFFVVPGIALFSLDVSGTSWSIEPTGRGPRIDFSHDQRFAIGYQELNAEGTYSQAGNEITLNYTFGGSGKYKLSIVEIDNIFCRYKLVGSGVEYFSRDHKPPQGERRKINGSMVFVYHAAGAVNGNARMREGPGLQYNSVQLNSENIIVPEGEEVTIYGRSENQTLINGVNAYWYYCNSWYDWADHNGWIWGGLIDFRK
jgi:hypothetical protein